MNNENYKKKINTHKKPVTNTSTKIKWDISVRKFLASINKIQCTVNAIRSI